MRRSGILAVALLLACHAPPPRPDAPHPRVVSLLPNATEILFALGAGDHVVGATRYCDRPEAAKQVPRVGGILDVSLEAVVTARPDLVIGSPAVLRGRLGETLRDGAVRLLPLTFETPASVPAGVLQIGDAVGRPAEAAVLAAEMRQDLDRLAGRARREPALRVLMVVGRNPLVVAGERSFLGDLLGRMGVANVTEAGDMAFPTWSLEQVIRADPDVVVDTAVEAGDLQGLLAGAGVRAGVQGRVVRRADEALIRPGPATAKAALALADRIVEAAGR